MKTTPLRKIRQHAAGIDLGSEEIFVAVEEQPVERFETFTASMARRAGRYRAQLLLQSADRAALLAFLSSL